MRIATTDLGTGHTSIFTGRLASVVPPRPERRILWGIYLSHSTMGCPWEGIPT